VTLLLGPRTRALLIVAVLCLAAMGAAALMLSTEQSSSDESPGATAPQQASPKTPAQPKSKEAGATAQPKPKSAAAPGTATVTGTPGAATQTAPKDQLPTSIAQALAANHVVVVALYDPRAKIDGTAVKEATAGAQLAGAAFASVDVTKNEVDALNLRYGVIQDPAVLVLRPPGDLVVRIDGFADRDTVAQAAANAAS
jgi:hypothetical protein